MTQKYWPAVYPLWCNVFETALLKRVDLDKPDDKAIYHFDRFTVDTQNFVVDRDGETVTLAPRSFDVLALLLKYPGQVVEKRQLFDEVWKETFVSDNALTKVVKELRHALADSADKPRYIETVPKRGYRFIGKLETNGFHEAPAETIDEVPDSTAQRSRRFVYIVVPALLIVIAAIGWIAFSERRDRSQPATVAVLPFKPLDSESRNESLELGMAETLITRLSNLRQIVVRPITSVRKFGDPTQDPLQAGRELQTEAVLDGSIQKSGERIRVTVRMLDVNTGATLWSEQFDDSFTDIFRVQDSIAERIAGALALKLSRNEQQQLAKHMTESPEAYEHYLQGQFHWHRRGPEWISKSLAAYKLALEKDPNFALAHIGVADAYIMFSGHRQMSMADAEAQAVPSIQKALEIDNSLAQAHNALAELKYQYQYDWKGAEDEFRIALDLNPNIAWIHQAYGWFLMSDGRFDEAGVELERARQLDPNSMTLSAARGRLFYFSRQYERAIQHFRELIALEPNDCSLRLALFNAYEANQMFDEAIEENLRPDSCNRSAPEKRELFREIYRASGYEAVVRKMLSDLEENAAKTGNRSAFAFAMAYVRLRDKENAFYWFEKLFDSRDVVTIQFKIEPAYDFLRDDPRYAALLARIGQKP
jgi:DNA-binding winged helix-turn-helix (wHTH) protein/TolB-like protein